MAPSLAGMNTKPAAGETVNLLNYTVADYRRRIRVEKLRSTSWSAAVHVRIVSLCPMSSALGEKPDDKSQGAGNLRVKVK